MILVTGGTGFLGGYILKHLIEKGYSVRALRRENSVLPFFIPKEILEKVEWFAGDILDVYSLKDAMDGAEAVIHSAAKVSFQASERKQMFQVNIDGTANVVNMALETRVPRLIHVSSVASLGRTMNGETVTEEKRWDDSSINTNYALSKYRAEMEVWRGTGEGLDSIILNPSTILGYGDWNNSSCAIFKTVYNEFPYYSNGINGFVYVEDVAAAAVQLLQSKITQERFILSSANWSFRQVFNSIADEFKKKRPHRHATPLLAQLAWRMEKVKSMITGKRSLLSKESARIAGTTTYFENAKILKALPSLSFTPLSEAIQLSCAQYLQNLING